MGNPNQGEAVVIREETEIFFTSDLHLGHTNIIHHCKRPFSSTEEMDETLIQNWNKVVGPDDIAYILGDFALAHPRRIESYLGRLVGEKHLIRGSHDRKLQQNILARFASIHDLLTIRVPDPDAPGKQRFIVLCHYAMRTWDHSHHGSWHLYGHSHGNLPENPYSLSFDIGVDCWNYRPVSYAQVKEKMLASLAQKEACRSS